MSSENLVDQVRELVQQFVNSDAEVTPDTALVKDLELESIQIIEMLCEVEDAFDVVIGESELSDVVTVADLAVVVEKNIV